MTLLPRVVPRLLARVTLTWMLPPLRVYSIVVLTRVPHLALFVGCFPSRTSWLWMTRSLQQLLFRCPLSPLGLHRTWWKKQLEDRKAPSLVQVGLALIRQWVAGLEAI